MNISLSDHSADQLWFRIAKLRPFIRDHVSVHRHEYRGDIWYVYHDQANNRFHRFDYTAHQFISLLDSKRCVNEVWEILNAKQNPEPPSREEIISLLGKLHRIDLLQSNSSPDTEELYRRAETQKKKRWKMFLRNPVSFRLSLFDPESLLSHALPVVKPIFTLAAVVAWSITLILAAILAVVYWNELSNVSLEQMLQPGNIFILVISYPLIKLLHELGHAFAVKHWGGEVHEIGVIFVLLLPIPYVDASAASAFSHKYQRVIVGAAGIMVELLITCIALFIWIAVEPGLVKNLAFNVMVLTGISTFLFNGNPLLRYDGYYVLSDMFGISNLSTRSNRYIGYLVKRFLFGLNDVVSPAYDRGESYWFTIYSPASFIYRICILFVITMLVVDTWFMLGVLLGIWIIYKQIISPLFRHAKYVLTDTSILPQRTRAIFASSSLVAFLAIFITVLPMPQVTIAQGIIRAPDNSALRLETNGFVKEVLVQNEQQVNKGETIITLEDPLQLLNIRILESRLDELNAQYNASWSVNHIQSRIIKDQITYVKEELNQSLQMYNALVVKSPVSGKIIIPNIDDLPGQYYKQGDLLAYIIPPSGAIARVAIREKDMGLLKNINNVHVAYDKTISEPVTASIRRIFPDTNRHLPDAALGTLGGGDIDIDISDQSGLSTIDKLQHVEIDIESMAYPNDKFLGKRVYVRFEHDSAPLVSQVYRSLQQMLLRRFSV